MSQKPADLELSPHSEATRTSTAEQLSQVRRAARASFIGTTIEWYDYFLYGTASALIFPRVFFSNLSPGVATFASLASFSVSWLLRPIGGVVFGHFGDRFSRKKMLMITLIMMGGSTFLIGVLPSYAAAGIFAPILLILLRMVQGLALGGEWGGAALIVVEHAPPRRRGLYGAAVQMGVPAGLLLSTAVVALASTLPDEAFFSWGWRVPFLLSIALVVVGYWLRTVLEDPKAFRQQVEETRAAQLPIAEVLATAKRKTILLALVQFACNTGYYIFTVYTGSYATEQLGMPRSFLLEALMIAAAVDLVMQPVFAALSDRIGRKPVYIFGSLFIGAWAFPFFALLSSETQPLVWLAMIGALGIGHAATGGINGPLYTEQYPLRMRYTGASLAFQLSGIVTSTPAPLVAAWLVTATGNTDSISVYVIASAVISVVCALLLEETYRKRIDE
ncbi:MFS transporter [Saccharopolyspora hattusasensis]|uniref:MFS transporter n=1 Tax=Saccharopolyspora hattusasensis TaxID=1128679 RepID=UPI003D95C6E0